MEHYNHPITNLFSSSASHYISRDETTLTSTSGVFSNIRTEDGIGFLNQTGDQIFTNFSGVNYYRSDIHQFNSKNNVTIFIELSPTMCFSSK